MGLDLQETIQTVIDIPAFIFHLSMGYFIFKKVLTKHTDFRGGFYHIFLLNLIINMIAFLQVSLIQYRIKRVGEKSFF